MKDQQTSFPLDGVPPLPRSNHSGKAIKQPIIQAMQKQLDAEQAASDALDKMIRALRKAQSVPPPPAPDGTRYRGAMESAPDRR